MLCLKLLTVKLYFTKLIKRSYANPSFVWCARTYKNNKSRRNWRDNPNTSSVVPTPTARESLTYPKRVHYKKWYFPPTHTLISAGDVTAQVAVIVPMSAQGYAIFSLVKWQLKCSVRPYKTFVQYYYTLIRIIRSLRRFISPTYSETKLGLWFWSKRWSRPIDFEAFVMNKLVIKI